MDVDFSQFLMTLVTFTMALTPMLAGIGRKLNIVSTLRKFYATINKREIGDVENHIIIIGFLKSVAL